MEMEICRDQRAMRWHDTTPCDAMPCDAMGAHSPLLTSGRLPMAEASSDAPKNSPFDCA
jgi:hypothetical protein